MESSSDSQSQQQQQGSVTGASWTRRWGNERLVVVGKSRFGDSSPALLEIFSCHANSTSTSLSAPPLATYVFEEGDPVSLAVHPNGDEIVCSLSTGDLKLFELRGQKASTELLVKELSLPGVGPQKCLAFSVHGSRFATGGLNGHLRIFEWPSLHILLDEPSAHKQVHDVDFSLDSEFLASTSTDGSARIWKTNDGVLVTSLTYDSDEKIECCQFSRDAAKPFLFCTIRKGEESATAVWDINTWNRIGGYGRLLRKPESVMSINLDGKHLQLIDMDEQNEQDSVSVVNSIVKNEDIDDEARELTATPLKRYVTMVVDNGSKWICNFGCKSEPYTGTYSRIRAHLIGLLPGQKSQGVALCSKVNKEEREKMKKEEDEAKRVFGGCTRRTPVSAVPVVPQAYKTTANVSMDKGKGISDKYRISSKDEVDGSVARFFYGSGIPINVAKSPFWLDMVRAINEAPKGYEPPSSEKIKTTLLDKEKTKVDQALISIKQQWPTYGVSIISDAWTHVKNESFVKVMAVSDHRAMLISGLDCSADDVSSEFIAELLLKAVDSVGAFNVVQILTDNAPTCKAAGRIIETAYPHIFWSGCVAHTLSLLLKDMVKSMEPALFFVANCYNKVKGVTDYLKNHGSSLYIIRTFPELDVLQVKQRRYGQLFLVLERILRVKNALINMVLSEEWDKLKRGRSKSDMEHEGVRKIVLDDDFWKKLKIIVTFMRPIWDLICFCDSDKACIGEVYQRIDDMLESIKLALPNNADLNRVIQNLVAGRWDKMDVPLYTVAYVLTPHYYSDHWLKSSAPGGKKRKKPHADPDVQKVYLDVIEQLVRDSKEASLIRQQLSDFVSNTGSFARTQAIKDRESMSALSWWHLYGASAPELYSLAIKVLSQCVNTTCAERELTTCEYIRNVKKNKMNAGRAESFVYVHYNHRLLTRNREDYEMSYRNWDNFLTDDNLEIDIEAIEDKEDAILDVNGVTAAQSLPLSIVTSTSTYRTSTQVSSNLQEDELVCSKRPRLRYKSPRAINLISKAKSIGMSMACMHPYEFRKYCTYTIF